MDTKELLQKGAEIKYQISLLTKEYEQIQQQILDAVVEFKETNNAFPNIEGKGTFSYYAKKKWTYTQFTQDSEKALEERKAEERKNGDAKEEETLILKFNVAE